METTRKIGEDIFTISPLGYEETCDLQPLLAPALADFGRLYALFIGEMARLLQQHGAEVAEADVVTMLPELGGSLDQASAIIAQVAAKLPATSLRTIRRTLLRGATMNSKPLYATTEGQPDMINTLMRGRTIDGWKLLLFALEVNYPDFFALARPLAALGGRATSSSTSTTTTPDAGPAAASS